VSALRIVPSPEDGPRLTRVQRERRQRIVNAALNLAAQGGYEAVQMREVAAMAGVALGTLYRYFSSKEHLLVAAMAEQVATLRQRLAERPARGETPAERVIDVLHRATRALQREPQVTSAMLKSLISPNADVAEAMQPVSETMTDIVVTAIHHAAPSESDHNVAMVIQHVWMASLLWWVAGLGPARQVEDRVNVAVHLLLGNGEEDAAPAER
jgi:AcrR family transcriptional regulator